MLAIRRKYADEILTVEMAMGKKLTDYQVKELAKQIEEHEKAQERLLKTTDKSLREQLAYRNKQQGINEAFNKKELDATAATLNENIKRMEANAKSAEMATAKNKEEIEAINLKYERIALQREEKFMEAKLMALKAEQAKRAVIKLTQDFEDEKADKELSEKILKIEKDLTTNKINQYKLDSNSHKKNLEEKVTQEADNAEKRLALIMDFAEAGLNARLTAEQMYKKGLESLNEEELSGLERHLNSITTTRNEANKRDKEAQKRFGKDFIDLTAKQQEEVTAAVKVGNETREQNLEDSFTAVNNFYRAGLEIYTVLINEQIANAKTAVQKAKLENQKMWVEFTAELLNDAGNVVRAWTKSIFDGIVATVVWAGKAIANMFTAKKRKAQAEMQELKEYYEKEISTWSDFMDKSQTGIEQYYGAFMNLTKSAQEYLKALEDYDPKFLINNELIRAEIIVDNYNKAIAATEKERDIKIAAVEAEYNKISSAEKQRHDTAIENINKEFNARIDAINKEFDARAAKELQAYNAETLAIKQAQTDQLLLLLTNEDSKTFIMAKYAEKRAKILKDTLLAETEIVDGMDQATIDSINAARELRFKYLSEAQDQLNEELMWTINNEGQKRKEYTETEKIQLDAKEALDGAGRRYAMAEIVRTQEKNQKIADAEREKNNAIETEKQRHDAYMLELDEKYAADKLKIDEWYNDQSKALGLAKDEALKASFEIVKEASIRGYDEIIAKAQEAYAKGVLTLEQYRAIIEEANQLRGIVGEGNVVTPDPTINTQLNSGVLALSPTNTDRWSSERVIEYLDWLKNNNLQDGIQARLDFLQNAGKYAEGTEYLQRGNNPPGVDTIPIMGNEGERIISTPDNQEIGDYTNKEVVAIVKNHRLLEQMAVAGVASRSQGLIRSFQTSAIAQTGMPTYSRPVSTAPAAGISYNLDTSALERELAAMNQKLELLELLSELPEMRKVSEEIRNKPVLSLDKLQREVDADTLNRDRSTFG